MFHIVWKAGLIALVVNCLFFLRGCQQADFRVTQGVIVPFAELKVDKEIGLGVLPSRLVDFSAEWLAVNLAAGGLVAFWLLRVFAPRRLLIALATSALLINSFMISMQVWLYTIYFPTAWIAQGTRSLLFLGGPEPDRDTIDPRLCMSTAARIWLVALFTLIYAGIWALAKFRARTPTAAESIQK